MDQYAFWNKALTGTEVTNLYNGGAGKDLTGDPNVEELLNFEGTFNGENGSSGDGINNPTFGESPFYFPPTPVSDYMLVVSTNIVMPDLLDSALLDVWIEPSVYDDVQATNLIYSLSPDAGATWYPVTWADKGIGAAGQFIFGGEASFTNGTGSNLLWRIETTNSLNIKAHAVGVYGRTQ